MTALITAAVLTFPLLAAAATKGSRPSLALRTSNTIVATWTCADQLAQPRQHAYSPWKTHSEAFRRAQLNMWIQRHNHCIAALHAHDNVIRRLQHGLAGTPMEGSEGPLEAVGRRYNISPYFIAAIAGTESSFGAAACSGNPYNAFGLSSCTTGWNVPYFRSWGEAYMFMAKFLTARWPNAKSAYDYRGYAKCSSCWGAKTAEHMRARFGVGASVVYP